MTRTFLDKAEPSSSANKTSFKTSSCIAGPRKKQGYTELKEHFPGNYRLLFAKVLGIQIGAGKTIHLPQ